MSGEESPDKKLIGSASHELLRPGEAVEVHALKSDGKAYRWWRGVVESTDAHHVAVVNYVGDVVASTGKGWVFRHHLRSIYWFARPYNLAEAYEPDGRLKQLYVHIAGLPVVQNHCLRYVDLELDVIRRGGAAPRVADEDEFEAATSLYGYSPELQASCWRAVEEALGLVAVWRPSGPPREVKQNRPRSPQGRHRRRSRR